MTETAMLRETREAPEAAARLLDREGAAIKALGKRLATLAPPVVVTSARGSSDNAAGYLKYLTELATGVPVASIGPSVASIYGVRLQLAGGAMISISQSGRSPDLVSAQRAARAAGALTVAIVNATDGALAQEADITIALHAGPEHSVAATKSFISSTIAAAMLVAAWSADAALSAAIAGLPDALARALACDWSGAEAAMVQAGSCYALGRGPGLAIAQETALKAKETSAIHAEAFSFAEVMHGPLRLVEPGFPVIGFVPEDAAALSNNAALARLAQVGGQVFSVGQGPGTLLPAVSTGHGATDPIAMAVSAYMLFETVSRARGHDPDHPAHLRKVTETI